jgi:hypothetical protein
MNQNPWNLENMAQYERERIQQEMRGIRQLEEALRARVRPPNVRRPVWMVILRWFIARAIRVVRMSEAPAVARRTGGQAAKI